MDYKKIGKALLFPHPAVLIVLLPVATAFLVYSMVVLGTETVPAYISYALAAYTLTVWCVRIPEIIRLCKTVKNENKLVRRWLDDLRLRSNITLYGSSVWNAVFAIFQLGLGYLHHTFWYYSLGGYYFCLAAMRLYLANYSRKNVYGENMIAELRRYRACGWVFLAMNMALSLIIFFMVYWNRTFEHSMITAIAMAAYTFWSFTHAIVGIVKYRKYNSPILSASKAISMAAACVSMLTLESTMLTTFGDGTMDLAARRIMLTATGAAVSAFVIITAVYMIAKGTREIKKEKRNAEQR
ncbi:MAG: hypothetical protein IJF21_05600 [Clostridia bacterium]|nr:hypothetical protein [Clostridia bacterium]MBQ3227649.1 hypothetical protein [Clostridia bacterium]